jgi:hypothetical protein
MNRPGQRALLIVALALLGSGVLLGIVSVIGDAATSPVAAVQPGPREPGVGPWRRPPGERPWIPGRPPFGRPTPNPPPSS